MRKILYALCLILYSLGIYAGDIYVEKNGSVAEALKQAREWRRLNSQEIAGGIRIHLADAVYPLQKPLFIRPEDSGTKDSPTIIMGGTLSGGIAVTDWKREGNLWVAEAPRDGNRIVYTRQLWVNGRKAQLARGPFVRLSDFNKESKTITLNSPLSSLHSPLSFSAEPLEPAPAPGRDEPTSRCQTAPSI